MNINLFIFLLILSGFALGFPTLGLGVDFKKLNWLQIVYIIFCIVIIYIISTHLQLIIQNSYGNNLFPARL